MPLFDALVGDTATCLALAKAFYARVQRDPVLRPLFPGKSLRCAIEQLAAFLVQLLGGPAKDTQERWHLSLRESHQRFAIGPRERDAWLRHMIATLDTTPIAEPARHTLRQFFEQSSAYIVNTGRVEPSADDIQDADLARCWQAQRLIDDAVAAIREGAASRAIALAEEPILRAYVAERPAVHASLLATMIGSETPPQLQEYGQLAQQPPPLREYVRQQLALAPTLVHERFSHDRTLLHAAAAAGDVAFVELLLDLGADVSAGVHSPLYCVGNECSAPGGAEVVRLLVRAGADVNAAEGPKRCTALHMAARRGNVDVAAALIDCGANIEARDRVGDTPLRRALNCKQREVAALLRARGATPIPTKAKING